MFEFQQRRMHRALRREATIIEAVAYLVINPAARVVIAAGNEQSAKSIAAEINKRLSALGVTAENLSTSPALSRRAEV